MVPSCPRALLLVALAGVSCGARSEPGGLECPAPDDDGDCHAALEHGGDDCDDHDPSVYPGAPDNAPGAFARQAFVNWYDIPFPFAIGQGPGGTIHALSCDGSGWYANVGPDGTEFLSLPTEAPGGVCTLWVDDDGLHVLYSPTPTSLAYAHHPGPKSADRAWSSEPVPSSGNLLAVDLWRSAEGRTWAAYAAEGRELVLAERGDGTWATEHVADIPGYAWLTLSGGDDGEPWLLSNRLEDIYANAFFTRRSPAGLSDERLSEGATSNMELALARYHRGEPELAFQYSRHGAYGPGVRGSRVEAHRLAPSGWERSVVDGDVWPDCMAIGVGDDGVAHLALAGRVTEGSPRVFRSYRRDRGGWVQNHAQVLDDELAGSFCAVFVDQAGVVTLLSANQSEDLYLLTDRGTPDGIDQDCDGVDG